ncbi:pentapeptide repeat-containing protein [Streptomyces sp. NPDC060027]|uniref:pentapeptide repeat-containing protein n=1 Tax=Streptomyces sp. NPDC060027 TaxID=3347040 RepID=UPI0036B08F5A
MHGASLRAARCTHADLSGADVRGADLAGADLSGVRWSVETLWPFEPSALRRMPPPSDAPGGFVLPNSHTSPELRRLLDGDH